ncbi:integrase, catalytic region, zinc finger, CCHC-type containing protein [Tanacetum coccineum]
MRRTIQNKVDRETRSTNEFDQFVAEPGEALVSVYNGFAQLMNDLEQNNMNFPTQFEKLVNTSRAKKLEKSHDPLALVAHTGSSSRNTSSYYVTHPTSVVDYDDEYQQDDVQTNSEDPLASVMVLLARDITQNFSNPTNNRLRTSSNTRNQAIIQGDMVNIQSRNPVNTGRNTRRAYVQKEVVNDFLFADASRMEEIEELNANICLMARIQPANNTSDVRPSYDSAFIKIPLNVRDTEDTLDDASKSQQKMKEKMNDPIAVANKQNCWTIDYKQINALYKDFVPQKELSAEQKYFSSSFIPSDKTPNATSSVPASMPSESPLIIQLDKMKSCFQTLSELIQKNCKRASIFYTSPEEIQLNDFCQDQVKPIVNELQFYFEFFRKLFQRDIKEMKDVFESTESELCEIKKQNDFLKDQLLEASLRHEVEITYGVIRAENLNLLITISELKTRLETVEKGKSVNTKFDKTNVSQNLLCVTPINKQVFQKKTVVSKTEEKHVVSKPVTLQTSPDKQRGANSNKNVIAPGMYKVVTTQESQTNEAKHGLSSTGMNAASSVRRPMNKDSHVKNSVLANSKNSAKKVPVYVRKNKQTDKTSANVISNKENVIDVNVANASKAKTLLCVSCMQNVLIPCHDKCIPDVLSDVTVVVQALDGALSLFVMLYYVEVLDMIFLALGQFFDGDLEEAFRSKTCIMQQFSTTRTPQQNGVVERRNRTLVEAARTMLIFSRLPEFLWAEAFHVFGSLCYPTNDRDDLGKMKPKADIGVFIGYLETSTSFQIYNRRTKMIMETIHVKFDELTAMASEHDCLEPELQRFNNYNSSAEPMNNPSKEDLDNLFGPMFEEYYEQKSSDTPIYFAAQQT